MGIIKDFIHRYFFQTAEQRQRSDAERRDAEIWKEADDLAEQGKFAEAAEVRMRYALEKLKESDLMYSLYCGYAFGLWLKAKEPDKALREARNILRVYVDNDGKWLKYDSGNYVEDLTSKVSDFFAAGYTAEAAVFAGEVNHQLEKHGLPMRCAAVPISVNIFPSSCSNCGAKLAPNPYHDTAQCGYCNAITYALHHTPETADAENKMV